MRSRYNKNYRQKKLPTINQAIYDDFIQNGQDFLKKYFSTFNDDESIEKYIQESATMGIENILYGNDKIDDDKTESKKVRKNKK